MPRKENQTPSPAVVMGLNVNALGTIRSLAHAGVPVFAVGAAPAGVDDLHRWMSCRTRIPIRKVTLPDRGKTSWREALLQVADDCAERPVLIPSSDAHVQFLSRQRDVLAPHFRFGLPDAGTLKLLRDKREFYAYAEEKGYRVPRSVCVGALGCEAAASGLRYPCILKAHMRGSAWNDRFPRDKVVRVESPNELERALSGLQDIAHELILQEVIPGGDHELHFVDLYIGAEGKLLGGWTGRKLRQYPIHFGTSTYTETTQRHDLLDTAWNLLSDVGFRGYASVEFKYDARDSSYPIIEVTPSRTWYPHALGEAAGVNIPFIWYQDLLGMAAEPQLHWRSGVAWIDEYRDLHAAISYVRTDELTLWAWLGSMVRPKAHALWSWRDPAPGLAALVRLLMAAVLVPVRRYRRRGKQPLSGV